MSTEPLAYASAAVPDPSDLRRAERPLRWIFWGALLLILDLHFSSTTNGRGFRFDILNDTLGMILIALGVFQLATFPVRGRFAALMTFVQVVSVLTLLETALDHFIFPRPTLLSLLESLLGLAQLGAAVAFFTAMILLCETYALQAAGSWRTTRLLYVIIYVVPMGLLYVGSVFTLIFGTSLNFKANSSQGMCLLLGLLPLFLAPVIHFFVSTRRMLREVEARSGPVLPP